MRINFPANAKVHGAWIIPDPNAPGATLAKHFQDLWRLWDWEGWVKPQIDAALSLGINTIGAIGDVYGLADGTHTQSEYKEHSVQIAEYLKSKDAYYLPCCGNVNTYVNYSLSAAEYAGYCIDHLKAVESVGNCIGVYVIDEPEYGFFADGYIHDCSVALHAAGCNLPRTVGCGPSRQAWVASTIDALDWLSIHTFTFPCLATFLDDYLTAHPDMDIVIGSTGKNMTGAAGTGGGSESTVVTDTRTVYNLAYSGHPRIRGVFQWSTGAYASTAILADPTPKDHGLFDSNTVPGHFAARQHKTDLVRRYTRGSVVLSKSI